MQTNAYSPPASFVDLLLDAVCVVDATGRFVYVSAASERIFGYTPAEMIGRQMIELVAPDDRSRTLEAANRIMSGHLQLHFENRYIRKDGQVVHIKWSARWSEKDQLRVAVAHDITEAKRAESMQAALYAISEAAHDDGDLPDLFKRIHQIIGELLPAPGFCVALRDPQTDRLEFPYQTGHDRADLTMEQAAAALYPELVRGGQPLLLSPANVSDCPAPVQALLTTEAVCWLAAPLRLQPSPIGALFLKTAPGDSPYTERDKELLRFVSTQIATAIERKQMRTRLQYMAQYDDLTNLPNRRLFHDRLRTALSRARRNSGRFSLLYIDLDRFKHINDTLGHAAGDLLLQQVARRLEQCVRGADTVARIGGDEFVVLIENVQTPENATAIAEKIRSALAHPIQAGGHQMRVLPSIGIAHFPDHGEDEHLLLRHADEAMYRAKRDIEGSGRLADREFERGEGTRTASA